MTSILSFCWMISATMFRRTTWLDFPGIRTAGIETITYVLAGTVAHGDNPSLRIYAILWPPCGSQSARLLLRNRALRLYDFGSSRLVGGTTNFQHLAKILLTRVATSAELRSVRCSNQCA
jgi:hypothetical protein